MCSLMLVRTTFVLYVVFVCGVWFSCTNVNFYSIVSSSVVFSLRTVDHAQRTAPMLRYGVQGRGPVVSIGFNWGITLLPLSLMSIS